MANPIKRWEVHLNSLPFSCEWGVQVTKSPRVSVGSGFVLSCVLVREGGGINRFHGDGFRSHTTSFPLEPINGLVTSLVGKPFVYGNTSQREVYLKVCAS